MPIRPAAPKHVDKIKNLLDMVDLPSQDLTPAHLDHFFVYQNEDEIGGTTGMELYGDVALLRSLAVRPKYREEGIGARLRITIEQHALRHGANEIYLLTTTASEYFARSDYEVLPRERLPKVVERTEEASQLCPASAICMRKRLGDPSTPVG